MQDPLFDKIKSDILKWDPAQFAEKYLTIDGEKFNLSGGGYKPFADIYRYVGIKALEKDALPIVIVSGRQTGKALSLDTELPTPNGFVKLSELKAGDTLFDENGNPCNIITIHPINLSPESYRLTFDDGTIVDACADHLWLTWDKTTREQSSGVSKIRNTKELSQSMDNQYSILSPRPLSVKTPEILTSSFHRYIISIKPIPSIPMKCITVDSPSNLFLITRSFIPTHNTTMAAVLEMYFMGCGLFGNGKNPPIRIIHAFPQLDMAFAYSKVKLNGMISSSAMIDGDLPPTRGQKNKTFMQSLLDTSSPTNDSLQFKQFVGGNHLWIESTGIDGNRLRGRTADVIFFDECQKMYSSALGNSTKVLTTSPYGPVGSGVQVYFGTPLQRGSEYWEMWNKSTQQYFNLGCAKCKGYFPLYTPNSNDWENTWIYGYIVRCSHCGHEQDKREAAEKGKWVATKPISDAKFIGFHINQLFMPKFTKEKIESEKPGVSIINTEKSYQNEVLGEFYHGNSSILSKDQIRDLCGDPERKFRASISPVEDLLVFAGIDIGEKADMENLLDSDKARMQGQSYSVIVVISVTGSQRISIEFAAKFKRNDLASKKGIIDEVMRKYSVNLGVIDLGYARDLSEILQTEYGGKMLSSQSLPRVNEKIKFNDQVFPKTICFEKDFWIADLFEQIKKQNVRIPLGSFEQISWFIDHCSNFELKPSVSRSGGDIQPHYIKSGGPTDGFSALLNAYLAMKFYISNGFSIKHPLLMKTDKKNDKIPCVGGSISFVKKMRSE